MSRIYEEGLSLHLCWTLDQLGYSPQQIQWRREAYKNRDLVWNSRNDESTFHTFGSKGEGLTRYFESDHDILHVPTHTLCVEDNGQSWSDMDDKITYLKMKNGNCSPGYTLIYALNDGNLCVSSERYLQFSHDLLKEQHINEYSVHEQAGPANQMSFRGLHMDIVYALRCKCPSILETWANRPRTHTWPPREEITAISKMDAFLVAKGFEHDSNYKQEWRLCFNLAEIHLLGCLNNTQIKLYVLLKCILKDILKPKHKEITSFILKNVVLWMAESYPQDRFQETSLISWLMKSLRLLKRSIMVNLLPYYMIPERNLLAARMTSVQRLKLQTELENLLQEGPIFLFRSKQLRDALTKCKPSELEHVRRERDELEILLVTFCIEHHKLHKPGKTERQHIREGEGNELIRQYLIRIYDMVLNDWRRLQRKCGLDIDEIVAGILERVLS